MVSPNLIGYLNREQNSIKDQGNKIQKDITMRGSKRNLPTLQKMFEDGKRIGREKQNYIALSYQKFLRI